MVSHRAIHGHVLVPASFVIPLDDDDDDDAWPAETRGVPLGSIVQRLRLRRDFLQGEDASDRRAQLDGLGFVWDVGERNFDTFVRALRHFDRLEGRRFDQMEGVGGEGSGALAARRHRHRHRRRRHRHRHRRRPHLPAASAAAACACRPDSSSRAATPGEAGLPIYGTTPSGLGPWP